jgi:DNA polymerase III epsilon subunit-like protein
MIIIVFDTETTGLPTERNPSYRDTAKWPHIVQLSYVLYDMKNEKTLLCEDHVIKLSSSVDLPPESVRIHGITRSHMSRRGIAIEKALEQFGKAVKQADVVVGHNLQFDKNIVLAEAVRNFCAKLVTFNKKIEYCTMQKSLNVCNIQRTNKYGEVYQKYPNLTELHEHLFRSVPKGTHDSMADVLITFRCFRSLLGHSSRLKCPLMCNLYKLYCS